MAKTSPKKSPTASKKSVESCCGAVAPAAAPDHTAEINRINRIKGQLDGIRKMIEERKYCPDILTQTSAVRSAIASLEGAILEKHLHACVRDAFQTDRAGADAKIEELITIFRKTTR